MTSYRDAGVDLEAAARAVDAIRAIAADASRPEVVGGIGGFAGLFEIPGAPGRLLVAATDGVGTKLEVARLAGRLDTVGIDLVAMCANDVVCTGAEPLFFLDYLAAGRVVPSEVGSIVAGIAEGCRRAGCALLGGETAEHPGVLAAGRFDLAGFCVGLVDQAVLLGPHRVRPGDVLVGLASTGLHANGYSLVRRVLLEDAGLPLDAVPEGLERSLADELLEPTAIYAPLVTALARERLVHSAAHVTGGGLPENLPRALPPELRPELDRGSWAAPAVFGLIERLGRVDRGEMLRTFNMGIGMVLTVPPGGADDVMRRAGEAGFDARIVGRVTEPEAGSIDRA